MPASVGTSSRFGFVLGQAYYWAINRSYDATFNGTLYTARGFASAVFVVYLSSIVNPTYAAVQYALLASLMALGVGPGDLMDEMHQQYKKDKAPLLPGKRQMPHNQYLQTTAGLGIPGGIIGPTLVIGGLAGAAIAVVGQQAFLQTALLRIRQSSAQCAQIVGDMFSPGHARYCTGDGRM